ncbi:hypothetical protein SEMRO_115_G056590.1 [Seminavis robusta]|uniref:Uncharacterized protein n=1 Tax=Seminavis robusta TaxID=568900 RepID=A0A9N8DGJ9_9STRA|nr:hypothetical protein SEMRO_115_G056590.1 [Seminavis robusta]|eukprot:Sro115_g056590.1 n/a (221) ;mRNA; f:1920-2677
MNPTVEGEPLYGTTNSGIEWTRVTPQEGLNVNDGSQLDKMHTVTMSIPSSLIEEASPTSLTLGFVVELLMPSSQENYGIDDLNITSFYTCAKTSVPSASVTSTPSTSTLPPTLSTLLPTIPSPSPTKKCEVIISAIVGNESFEIEPVGVTAIDGIQVDFDFFQTLTESQVSWLALLYTNSSGVEACGTAENPQYGSNALSYSTVCDGDYASVDVYFHDPL